MPRLALIFGLGLSATPPLPEIDTRRLPTALKQLNFTVVALTDFRSSVAAVREWVVSLPAKSDVLVVFSGHAKPDPANGLLLQMAAGKDLPLKTIVEDIGKRSPRATVFVVDSCYAGASMAVVGRNTDIICSCGAHESTNPDAAFLQDIAAALSDPDVATSQDLLDSIRSASQREDRRYSPVGAIDAGYQFRRFRLLPLFLVAAMSLSAHSSPSEDTQGMPAQGLPSECMVVRDSAFCVRALSSECFTGAVSHLDDDARFVLMIPRDVMKCKFEIADGDSFETCLHWTRLPGDHIKCP